LSALRTLVAHRAASVLCPLTDSRLWRCRFLLSGFWHPNGEDDYGNESGGA
jgi:hypothetical protein